MSRGLCASFTTKVVILCLKGNGNGAVSVEAPRALRMFSKPPYGLNVGKTHLPPISSLAVKFELKFKAPGKLPNTSQLLIQLRSHNVFLLSPI